MGPLRRSDTQSRIGSVLDGKWTLDAILGKGGSATVYAATHRNGKRAAVKVLHAHCLTDPDLVARFIREGYFANKIAHPGVVSVVDDQIGETDAYIVMDLLEGASLDARVRGAAPPLGVVETFKVMADVLDVLIAAHAIGLVHRDIKPANLFITTTGQLKVLDFGIARLNESVGDSATQTGALMGTPAFMPPEQARARWNEVDHRTDLWALGSTAIALMLGRRPRRAETSAEELLAAMTAPLPPMTELDPSVPADAARVIDRSVAFDPKDRYQSAVEMRNAVMDVIALLENGPHSASHLERTVALGVLGDFGQLPKLASTSVPRLQAEPTFPMVAQARFEHMRIEAPRSDQPRSDPSYPQPPMSTQSRPDLDPQRFVTGPHQSFTYPGSGSGPHTPIGPMPSHISAPPEPSLTTHRGAMMSRSVPPLAAPPASNAATMIAIGSGLLVALVIAAGVYVRYRPTSAASTPEPAAVVAPPPAMDPPARVTTPVTTTPVAANASANAVGAEAGAPAQGASDVPATTPSADATPAAATAKKPVAPRPKKPGTAAPGGDIMDNRF